MTLPDQTQHVFRALADPTRRAILTMLADGARPINEIAGAFEMTRPAIAKHLTVLREGGLVIVDVQGRKRINKLNPVRLKDAVDWLNHFDRFWDERLAKLKQTVEKEK